MLQGEHSAILSTFIKLPFVIKIFVLSIFECPLYRGFTVYCVGRAFQIKYTKVYDHVKYNIGLKTLLQRGISEPIFYGDLVYKFKQIVGKPNFSDQFKKIVKRYIRVGYNLDIMRQSACLVVNPITVYSYGFLFNCTTVGRASDSMTALT